MVNELEHVRTLVEDAREAVVVVDADRRLVAASPRAKAMLGDIRPGARVGEEAGGALVLFVGALPELSAYQELRAGFTAAVSHELRTPLARLLAVLESAGLPGADVDALIEQAKAEVELARGLIDDVLFLGELETGREVVALGSTRALPLLREVVGDYTDRAAHAQVALELTGGEDVELPLRPRMLRVVAENLVANAIRYAGAGSTCRIRAARVEGVSELTVADDGSGVAPDELGRIFERFYRADTARSTRGTGLGLAIVKHVVTAAGGTVDARGARGGGLQVVCRFPAR